MGRLDYGQVDVDLGGEVYTLRPTLGAMQKIDRHFGSIREATVRVRSLSFEGMVVIIAAGAGLGHREAKELPERVFAAGVLNLSEPLADYLSKLMNPSGREDDEPETEGEPGKA